MLRFAGVFVLVTAALAAFYAMTDLGGFYLLPVPFLVAAYDGGLRLHTHTGRFASSLEAWCLVFAYVAVTFIMLAGALAALVVAYPGFEAPMITAQLAAYAGGGAVLTLVVARLLILAASRRAYSVII